MVSPKTAKRVLITGANSFIGRSFENWASNRYPGVFRINTLDMLDEEWRKHDFSDYDCVFHVAGIAHADIGKVSEERKQLYFQVNCDLARETAQLAKSKGVKQFIFMSSIIIYGEAAGPGHTRLITDKTLPKPANFYGDSKWQGDQAVRHEASDTFRVAVVRPPMIYGRGSKGNYPALSKFARKLPLFPSIKNERSMLHIDNLCEFLCLLMSSGQGGIYFPQNKEYVSTKEMVKLIAHEHGKTIRITPLFNWAIHLASHIPGKLRNLIRKAFGNLVYAAEISQYAFGDYQIRTLEESIKETEG